MKTIFLLTLSLLLYSCNQKTSSKDKELPDFLKDIYVTDNTDIIGSWTMCSTFGDGTMIQFNVCPTVSFFNNGTGYMGNESIPAEQFTWTLTKGALKILYKDKISNSTFSDTFYNAIITKQNDLQNLIISQTKNDNTFYLSK
jgi:hypothetical protein